MPRVAVARAQSGTAVFSVSGMSRHESSRGVARPKKARPERKARHNGTALLPRDAEVEASEMARTPVAVYIVRLASRLPSTDGTRFDHDIPPRAKPHAPPFSAHPVFGPSRRGVGRPLRPATARRDDTGDTQARIRRMRLFASVRARFQRDRRSSPRASRASPRGSFKLTLVTGAFRSRLSNTSRRDSVAVREKKARARARRSETRAGTSSRKRASSATPRSKRAGLATLARLAPATWRASRRAERTLTRTNDEANLHSGNARDENIRPAFTKNEKPFAPPLRLDANAPPSFSKRVSRLRAARVSVPRPTPRGDELWLAQRMREVGARVSSREREASEARGKARASVFLSRKMGVVGRAATRATRAESRKTENGKRSGAAEPRSSAAESRTYLSSRTLSSQTSLPKTSRSVTSVTSSGRVTFTTTPSPFDPRVRRRIFTESKKKAPANRDDSERYDSNERRADAETFVSRVDEVFAADAAAWDVAGSDTGSDGEQSATERAMLESLRAARARDA